MTTFNEAMVEIATRVKSIMGFMQFPITDKGVPTVLRVAKEEWKFEGLSMYNANNHTIYFLYDQENPITDRIAEIVISHEMVHAYQNIDLNHVNVMDSSLDAYWEQEIEIQAHVVQDIYTSLYLLGNEAQSLALGNINKHISEGKLDDLITTIINFQRNALNKQMAEKA